MKIGKVTHGMCRFSGHLQQGPLLQVGFSREQTGTRSYHAGCLLLGNALQIGGCERKGKTGCPSDCPSLAEMARASGSHLDLSLDLVRPGVAGSWVRRSLQLRQSLKRATAEGAPEKPSRQLRPEGGLGITQHLCVHHNIFPT